MRQRLIVVAFCFLATIALGQTRQMESAKELERSCTAAVKVFDADGAASAQDAVEYGKCLGYVEGVLDSMRILKQTANDGRPYDFHLHGDGFVVKDAVVFFLDFMKTDKKYDHNGSAAPVIIQALVENHLLTTSAASAPR
jgi:hypothetical protein